MRKKRIFGVSILAGLSLTLTACMENDANPAGTTAPENLCLTGSDAPGCLAAGVKTGYLKGDGGVYTEIRYVEKDGMAVVEGDMLFPLDLVVHELPLIKLAKTSGGATAVGQYRWTAGPIPYRIDPSLTNASRVTNAIAHWEANTSVRFVVRTNQGNYINFQQPADPNECSAVVGMVTGAQPVNLGSNCWTPEAIHEIGHAIGFWHEQSRTDRDAYININWGNIKDNLEFNFRTYAQNGDAGTDFGPFDFQSIMLYRSYIADPNWVFDPSIPVLTRKDGTTWPSTTVLSAGDKATANAMYLVHNQLGGAVWSAARDMTSLGSYLYILHNSRIYRVNPNDGSYAQIGGASWDQAWDLTSLNSYLYVIHNSRLYRVDPNSGSFTQLGGAVWSQAVDLCALNGNLYVLHNSRIYRVNPNDGSYVQIGGAWWNQAVALSAHGSDLYTVHANWLYRVNPNDGSYDQLGVYPAWSDTKGMAPGGNRLYIVQGSGLFTVDLQYENYVQSGRNLWAVTQAMTSLGSSLYLVENAKLYKVGPI